MSHHSATEARRLFFRLLDAVQRGEEVTIERDGVRFRLVRADAPSDDEVQSPFTRVDAAVLDGNWTWAADDDGQLQFRVAEEADRASGSGAAP